MPLIVTREGAAPESLSVQAALDALAPDSDLSELFATIKRCELFAVKFHDGTRGTLSGVDGPIFPANHNDPQGALALLAEPQRDFELECELMVPVAVRIRCAARNKLHAQTIAEEVFRGIRSPERGFAAWMNRDEAYDQFADLRAAVENDDFSRLRYAHLLIRSSHEIYPETANANDVGVSRPRGA